MISQQANTIRRIYVVVLACVGWFGLVLQFPLSIATSRANGMALSGAIVAYFSFFTILTNLIVALGLTCSLAAPDSRWGRFFSSTVVASGTALYITVVGAVYSLLLRRLWDPECFQKIADIILHDAVRVLYVVYWMLFVPKGGLRWKDALSWSIYPLVYLAWVLIRGAVSGRYPYPFIDVGALGYTHVLFNAVLLLASFMVAGLAMVAATRWWQARGPVDGAHTASE